MEKHSWQKDKKDSPKSKNLRENKMGQKYANAQKFSIQHLDRLKDKGHIWTLSMDMESV